MTVAKSRIVALALLAAGAASAAENAGSAAWIWSEGRGYARIFRNSFEVKASARESVDVTADTRYVLKLDGRIIGRGPDRDTVESWTYRTYDLDLRPGSHVVEAVVYHGGNKPLAQMSHAAGFFVRGHGALAPVLTTGRGAWTAADVTGFRYGGPTGGAFGAGLPNVVEGSSPEFRELPESAFGPVTVVREETEPNEYYHRFPGWRLSETRLPPQIATPFKAGDFPQTVAARSEREIVIPLGNYYTAYPFLRTRGGTGAEVKVAWAESRKKLERGEFFEDTYLPDGGTGVFSTSWFRAGTLLRLRVRTAAEPLEITGLDFTESRYPLVGEGRFACDDPTVAPVLALCRRGLEMCAHEGVYDCPFYEQLTYLGDTRVQFLAQNAITSDDRLQKHCLELFSQSRGTDGLMPMNTPCDGPQSPSSTYTMVYPIELGDYLAWHADRDWLERQIPGLVATMEGLAAFANGEGLLENLSGWCFIDWTDWAKGGAHLGAGPEAGRLSALENLFYAMALESAARVTRACGRPELAAVYAARRTKCAEAIAARFWDEGKGAVADGADKRNFSEHAQVLAILADVLTAERKARAFRFLLEEPSLRRTSVYFSHYLFEALGRMGRTDLILRRLDLWRDYLKAGYVTPLEMPEPTRSDCHGWGGHPVCNLPRYLAGVEPVGDFFRSVRIAPNPAGLRRIDCAVPSPRGAIEVELSFAGDEVFGTVTLPEGLDGVFAWRGRETPLKGGTTVEVGKPRVILDTDAMADYDDIGAMSVLHALANEGRCEVLGVAASNSHSNAVPVIEIVNRFFGRGDLPVARPVEGAPSADNWCKEKFADRLVAAFAHPKYAATAAGEDPRSFYRRLLKGAPDGSVTVCVIGWLSNVAAVLGDPADRELFRRKVRRVVVMGGNEASGEECNLMTDGAAARRFAELCPSPVVYSMFHVGEGVRTGTRLVREAAPSDPVALAYGTVFAQNPQDARTGRSSWDQTAVLCAVTGGGDAYSFRRGRMEIRDDSGRNAWRDDPGGRDCAIDLRVPADGLARRIEALMLRR